MGITVPIPLSRATGDRIERYCCVHESVHGTKRTSSNVRSRSLTWESGHGADGQVVAEMGTITTWTITNRVVRPAMTSYTVTRQVNLVHFKGS